jgi:hypothetical protein
MNAHPQSRAERRNMKYKRGEYAPKEESDSTYKGGKLSKHLKELLKDQESKNELKEGKVLESTNLGGLA